MRLTEDGPADTPPEIANRPSNGRNIEEMIMNAKLLYIATVAASLLASTVAMASDATQFDPAPGTRSRADVKAELAVARAYGQLEQRGESYGAFPVAPTSTLSRAEVKKELAIARANGELVDRGDSYGAFPVATASTRTRAEVRAEARATARRPDWSYR